MGALLAFLILAFIHKHLKAEVVVRKLATKSPVEYMDDEEALFGPRITAGYPVVGRIYAAIPVDGCCESIPLPDNHSSHAIIYISLIKRGNCPFETKIRAAAHGGYGAAVIYNNENDAVFPMSKKSGVTINISSVMIGLTNGLKMLNYVLKPNSDEYIVEIYANHESNIEVYLIPVVSLLGLFILGLLVLFALRWCERRRRLRYRCLSSRQVRRLPLTKFKQSESSEGSCAICLEDFAEGDKLRHLPCDHVYHSQCIDPWLLKNSRVCPICKRVVFSRTVENPLRCVCCHCCVSIGSADDDLESRLISDSDSLGVSNSTDNVTTISAFPSTSYAVVEGIARATVDSSEPVPELSHENCIHPAESASQMQVGHSSPPLDTPIIDVPLLTDLRDECLCNNAAFLDDPDSRPSSSIASKRHQQSGKTGSNTADLNSFIATSVEAASSLHNESTVRGDVAPTEPYFPIV